MVLFMAMFERLRNDLMGTLMVIAALVPTVGLIFNLGRNAAGRRRAR